MEEPQNQPLGWKPPIPVGTERLKCAYCSWSCPLRYQNQTGPEVDGGRDGYTRLTAHVAAEHAGVVKRAKLAARARRRYAERKVLREQLKKEGR